MNLEIHKKNIKTSLKKIIGWKKNPKKNWDHFYNQFELEFRGDPKFIAQKLHDRYHFLLEQLVSTQKDKPFKALDIGCGGGEFLSILKELGFNGTGIDISPESIAKCKNKRLYAKVSDALTFLSACSSSSFHFISLIHIIEHLPTQYTFELVAEIKRVLKPGGACLIETPSNYSLWASARQFYLDPTHVKPIHPEYIKFLLTYHGFQVNILEFDEVIHPHRPQFTKTADETLQGELNKIDHFLFGKMDAACWATLEA